MIHHPSLWIRSTLTLASAITLSSCVYDSGYYGPPAGSYRGSLSTTYSSPGYSSTSLFISTGNPRWGYDPYCHSYFDYTTRCYYDPYLNGYYPYGYRPPVIVGVPHPYGWRPGHRTCPPPRHYRNYKLRNHEHRDLAYRKLDHSWAKNVRVDKDAYERHSRDRHNPSNPGLHPVSTVTPPSTDRHLNREIKRPGGSTWNPNRHPSVDREFEAPRTRPETRRPEMPKPERRKSPQVAPPLPLAQPDNSASFRPSSGFKPSHRSANPSPTFRESRPEPAGSMRSTSFTDKRSTAQTIETQSDRSLNPKPYRVR